MADKIVDKVKTGSYTVIKDFTGTVPAGKRFEGWSTEPNGKGTIYKPGRKVQVFMTLNLHPVFVEAEE